MQFCFQVRGIHLYCIDNVLINFILYGKHTIKNLADYSVGSAKMHNNRQLSIFEHFFGQ
jgi:hypothetical protein